MKFLAKPYPFTCGWSASLLTALAFGAFVFVFLSVFQPFGLAQLQAGVYWYSLAFGLVTFAGILLVKLPLGVSRHRDDLEDRWNIGLEVAHILLIILFIAAGNFLLALYFRFFDPGIATFLRFIGFTLAIGLFPVTFVVMLRQMRLYAERTRHSNELNESIADRPAIEEPRVITFHDEEGRQCISVPSGNVLFISAADNYVEVYYLQDASVCRELIRNSLKNLEAALRHEPYFFRCHRSFMVNVLNIQRVEGNARGYLLHLHSGLPAIPVSRTRIGAFDRCMATA